LGWDWSCYSKLHHRLLYHHPLLKKKKKLHSRASLSLIQQAAKQQSVTQKERERERAREEKERVLEA
jgi:hypothetical protein